MKLQREMLACCIRLSWYPSSCTARTSVCHCSLCTSPHTLRQRAMTTERNLHHCKEGAQAAGPTSWRLYSPQHGTEAKCEMYDVGARRLWLR
jgi:hypothetical protein